MEPVLELLLPAGLDSTDRMEIKEWLREHNIRGYEIRDDLERTVITFGNVEDRNTFMLDWLYSK